MVNSSRKAPFFKSNPTEIFVNLVQNTEVMRQTPSPSAVLAKKKSFVPTNVTVDGLQRLIQHFCFEEKQEATEMMVCFNCF